MPIGMFNLGDILSNSTTINYEKVLAIHDLKPKRICFSTTHLNALKALENMKDVKWAFNLPFDETIKKIFEQETGYTLCRTKYGFWYPLKTDEEYKVISDFINKYEEHVFLRDTLDLSMAISEHIDNDGKRTKFGELEYQAKYHNCSKSRIKITDQVIEFIAKTPLFNESKFICAVPSSNPNKINLPEKIARRVASQTDLTDISGDIFWKNEKESLKSLSFENKWQELEETDLVVQVDKKIKSVILIDDLYQSGTTLQFVAMKLKENGVKRVYGLAIVKSRKDSDNQ